MAKVFVNDFLSILMCYFLMANLFSIVLIFATLLNTSLKRRKYPRWNKMQSHHLDFVWPSISIIAPAHNEEKSIASSVRSLLALNYPHFEVIVVNDGSVDKTMEVMIRVFQMVPYQEGGGRTKYQSVVNPNLFLVNKVQGGKADALNVGIKSAKHALFCAIDSDSLLEPDALLKMVVPFVDSGGRTIAAGGTVRVVNGSIVRGSRVEKFRLPSNFLALMQMVEYSRAFLFGRCGWGQIGANLLISGAFGLFDKKAVLDVGGYNTESIGEDMELVVRLHSHFRKLRQPYRVEFNADPVCWTEVPTSWRGLYRQRHRWQRGLADSLTRHRHMFLNPKFGLIGLLGMPYQVIVELLGPAIELSALLALFLGFFGHFVSTEFALLFLAASVLFSMITSVLTVLVENYYFSRHWSIKNLSILVAIALLENIGYRQMLSVCRLMGLFGFFRGNTTWGTSLRGGFAEEFEIQSHLLDANVLQYANPNDLSRQQERTPEVQ